MTSPTPFPPAAQTSRLRTEIQLLRALAVLAVVANHLFPGRFGGGYLGVDTFFVISGYLITAHLLRELDATGRIRLGAFWARRVRRLIPASLLVLLVSATVVVLVVPATLWHDIMREIVAAGLYVENWVLALDASDYWASGESPSPVTHYWSLSLEEQFYLVWPLLVLGAYALGRRLLDRRGRSPRMVLIAVLGLVVAASLVYSVIVTASSPSSAYYLTPARMWQLGIGGLLACLPALSRGRHVVAATGWLVLLGSLALFDVGAPVPGWITLAPVLGVAAVIWSGDAFVRRVPAVLRPVVDAGAWVGGISYSLYLWHWPAIVLLPYATGTPLSRTDKLVLLVGVILLAWATARLVEDPLRRARWLVGGHALRTFVPMVCAMVAVVLVGQGASHAVGSRTDRVEQDVHTALDSGERCFGARAIIHHCARPHLLRFTDAPLLHTDTYLERPTWGDACMAKVDQPEVAACQFGVPRSESTRDLALIGDSHSRTWFPALEEIAHQRKWNITIMAKPSCPVNGSAIRTRNYPEYVPSCRAWNRSVIDRIVRDDSIDAVVTSSYSRNYVIGGVGHHEAIEEMTRGYREVWQRFAGSGKKVIAIGDMPQMGLGDIPTCVAKAGRYADPCTTPARKALSPDPLLMAARQAHDPDIVGIDLHRIFCGGGRCHSVIGGIVAYQDGNHMIGYFARTMAQPLDDEIGELLD